MPERDPHALASLFSPTSVAVVGASDDPHKWGHWIAARALRGAHRRKVHLVNRRATQVLGHEAAPSISAVREQIDLVVLAVPAGHLPRSIVEATEAGARAVVVISTNDEDADGAASGAELAAIARSGGAVLVGPNCLGIYDAAAELELVSNDLPQGEIGLISQSGQLSLEIGSFAADVGLGLSRFISLGDQVDLGAAELIRQLAAHEATRVIAVYVEDFRDGRDFVEAARGAGKPVVLLVGEGRASARAVHSHTGALASDGTTIEAACRAAGMIRVRTPRELVDACEALLRTSIPAGDRVAVLADGGGHGSIAASRLEELGLTVPELSPDVAAGLREVLPGGAAVGNPIDLAGAGESDIDVFPVVAEALLGCGEVDALVVTGYFGGYSEYSSDAAAAEIAAAERLAEISKETERPILVHSMHPDGEASRILRSQGIPVYDAIERPARTLGLLATVSGPCSNRSELSDLVLPRAADPLTDFDYPSARSSIAEAGVKFPRSAVVEDAQGAAAAMEGLSFPIVVKALGQLHKSDSGGVVLGIETFEDLDETIGRLQEKLDPTGFSIEEQAPVDRGVELLVGTHWDRRFGPIVLVGMGGVASEVLRDVSVALAPVDSRQAEELLLSLRGAPLLGSYRGRQAVDLGAAGAAVAALSRFAASHPELSEVEVNPLLVLPDSAIGLDARIVPQ